MRFEINILSSFSAPIEIGTNPYSFIWILPVCLIIAVAYKAIKMPKLTPAAYFKEIAILTATIIFFMFLAAIALYTLMLLVLE